MSVRPVGHYTVEGQLVPDEGQPWLNPRALDWYKEGWQDQLKPRDETRQAGLACINELKLKKPDTPILGGYQIFHNYIRPNQALKGRTPAEAAGIQVNGEKKWLTLIQNAAHAKKRR